jgi:hypothetical protein
VKIEIDFEGYFSHHGGEAFVPDMEGDIGGGWLRGLGKKMLLTC